MTTFTIFFCGTGSTKYDNLHKNYWNGELVATLANNIAGHEFAEWIVIDGPGSGNMQADELFTESKGFGWTGTAFGKGWHENVQHALNIIRGQFDWQRTKLSEADYQRLKRADVPIPDAQAHGSWFWRQYDYGNRISPQELQRQLIKNLRKRRLDSQTDQPGGVEPRRGELPHARQRADGESGNAPDTGQHIRGRSGARSLELPA